MSNSRSSISFSVRRHFVDKFFFSYSNLFTSDKQVLDIGGKKNNKRGLFSLGKFGVHVTYVNIEKRDEPDILADATKIPVEDASYNIIILGEVLEHVPEPIKVLKEAHRILREGGLLLATVPFMYPVHADPYDFGRYTDYFWQEAAKQVGFKGIKVERQGTIFAVMALMVQHFFRAKKISWRPIQTPLVSFFMWLDNKTKSPLLTAWTTGYGIMLTK